MKTKYLAVAASLIAILLAGCGPDKAEQKASNLPQPAPAQQVQIQQDKVLSKGKIVGKTKVADAPGQERVVDVEEREVETINPVGKKITEKRYYIANTNARIHYDPNEKDTTIKNEGKQLADFKVK